MPRGEWQRLILGAYVNYPVYADYPQLTLAMVHRWTVRGHQRLSLPDAQDRRAHLEGRAIHDAAVKRWLVQFLGLVFGRWVED